MSEFSEAEVREIFIGELYRVFIKARARLAAATEVGSDDAFVAVFGAFGEANPGMFERARLYAAEKGN